MALLRSSLTNIFKTIFSLNSEKLKNENTKVYNRLKFEEAIAQMNDVRETNVMEVTDKEGNKVQKVIN